jgi:hypothetical protein
MTKNELREKIKSIVKQIYKPETLSGDGGNEISLDAPKFPVLEKFPELKKILIDLLTNQYEIFVTDIQWVAPRPTTFRIVLANGETFILTYTPRSWIATIEGKKYYLLNISEEQQAAQSIARILSYGIQEETPPEEGSAEGAQTGGTEESPEEVAPEEEEEA